MRQYDPNPGLSAFAVVIGGVLGLALGVVLGLGAIGVVLTLLGGILVVGFLVSAFGVVGERGGSQDERDDLPPEYHDY